MNTPLELVEAGDRSYRDGDYETAKTYYEDALALAAASGQETNYIYSCVSRVYKKSKHFREAYQISARALPTPAAFRDCAICLRALANETRKSGDRKGLEEALNGLYSLAVLACLCYGKHDCQMGVSGLAYDRALYIHGRLNKDYRRANYAQDGSISGGGLLTERDYRLFLGSFGQVRNNYEPQKEYASLLRAADESLSRRRASIWN